MFRSTGVGSCLKQPVLFDDVKISPSSLELSDVQPGSEADAVFYIVNLSKHTVFDT